MHIRVPFRALAAALLLAAAAAPAGAAPKKPDFNPALPSFVDLNRVLAEYRKTPAFVKYQAKLREQAQGFSEEMQFLAQLRYCTPEEKKEALAIKAKGPTPTGKDKDRLDALMKKADTLDNELTMLGQKTKPTDQESKRMQDLSKMRTDAAQNLAKEEADRRDKLRALESDLMTEVEDTLLKVVDKVGKDLKVTTIYERRAVLTGGNDLTDEVIKKLPGK